MGNKKFIVGRHFINNEATFETFKEIIRNVNRAVDLYMSKSLGRMFRGESSDLHVELVRNLLLEQAEKRH